MANDQNKTHEKQWTNPIEFLMTCIGFAVGLGNVWRYKAIWSIDPFSFLLSNGTKYLNFILLVDFHIYASKTAAQHS